jgi:hypothetical protein
MSPVCTSFSYPIEPTGGSLPHRNAGGLTVMNLSDEPATVRYDGHKLDIVAPNGFTPLLLDATTGLPTDCNSLPSEPSLLSCSQGFGPPNTLTFTTADAAKRGEVVNVTYPAGWNLIGGTPGTPVTEARGPLYWLAVYFPSANTFMASYRPANSDTVSSLAAGYWAYFDADTTVGLRLDTEPATPVRISSQGIAVIGNPFSTAVNVTGPTALYRYDSDTASYELTTSLEPGEGAVAYGPPLGSGGGDILLTPRSSP